jgi:hypothetical protein
MQAKGLDNTIAYLYNWKERLPYFEFFIILHNFNFDIGS